MSHPPSPPPPAAILQLILNVWATQSAASFARLGLADLMGRIGAEGLAQQTGQQDRHHQQRCGHRAQDERT